MPFLQVDALTNYGNLGGPVITADGVIVGLVTLMGPRAPWLINSGVGIASDSASIARSLDPMRHLGGDLGRPRPGLGVLLDDEMRVLRVVDESGADVAGVLHGDILLAIDDAPMEDLYDLRGLLAGRAIGDQLTLRLQRDDDILDLEVTLGELQ
ncbi:MAG: serine protease [Planctomycetota bacterium]|nr:MAG: serine protease [Planctomycetota bacterium]